MVGISNRICGGRREQNILSKRNDFAINSTGKCRKSRQSPVHVHLGKPARDMTCTYKCVIVILLYVSRRYRERKRKQNNFRLNSGVSNTDDDNSP